MTPTVQSLQPFVDATARSDWRTVVDRVQAILGRQVTAYLAGMPDARAITRWANGTAGQPRSVEAEQRLRETFTLCQLLTGAGEADTTIRAWFLGLNPGLDDTPPVDAIRDGRLREVRSVALAFAGGA